MFIIDRAIELAKRLGVDTRKEPGTGYKQSHAALIIERIERALGIPRDTCANIYGRVADCELTAMVRSA